MVSTDPNDPSFGLETDQSSPNFGLAPEQSKSEEGGIVHSIVSEGKSLAGQAAGLLNPLNLVRGVLDIQPRSGLQEVMRTGRLLKDIVGGMPVNEAVRQEAPEVAQQQEAIMGKHGPEAQHEALGAIGTQLGMVAAPFIHGKIIPLREIAGFKAPEVMPSGTPATFAPAEEPYNHETGLQVMPETRFQMVDEPPPEIAPSRNIMETARYQPTSRPGEETPLASDAFPSISRSAEESRRAARTVDTGIESETARVGGEPEPPVIPEVNTPASLEAEAKSVTGNAEVPDFNPNAAKSPQEVAPVQEAQPPTAAEIKPEEAPTEAVEPPRTGVSSQRFTEQYGEDAPVPNTGRSASELKAIGQSRLDNYQKAGGAKDDPYSVLTNLRDGKVPVSQLADDVSLLRAEHQRLKSDARNAEGTPEWEAKSQASLDMAKAIKEVAHGPASDMMRSFQEYDKPRYDNVTDFDQALREREGRESTSLERVKFKEMADDVTNTRNGKEEAINGVQKRLSKMPKMGFEDAYKNIHDQLSKLTENCIVK